MRKYNEVCEQQDYKIIAVDDEDGIIDSLAIVLKRSGYQFTGVTNPVEAIELIKNNIVPFKEVIGCASFRFFNVSISWRPRCWGNS